MRSVTIRETRSFKTRAALVEAGIISTANGIARFRPRGVYANLTGVWAPMNSWNLALFINDRIP